MPLSEPSTRLPQTPQMPYDDLSSQGTPMATLPTSEIRTALISWKGELLKLAVDFPEHFTASIVEARLDAMDAALLAIDGSTTVTLTPATCAA